MDRNLQFDMPKAPGAKKHPRAYRKTDGRTVCPECHAISLSAEALEMIPCSKESAPLPPRIIIEHRSKNPPKAVLGDLWENDLGIVRILTERVFGDDVEGITWQGVWRRIDDHPDGPDSITVAPTHSGSIYNDEVIEMAVTKEVDYLSGLGELEANYYRIALHEQLMQHLKNNHMIAIKDPQFVVSEHEDKKRATVHASVLARTVP